MSDRPTAYHAMPATAAVERLGSDAASGLTTAAARRRLAEHGPNRLREEKREPIWEEFLEELREPMMLLLLVTAVLYSLWGKPEDALTIFAVILTLTAIEVYNDFRARRAIAALRKLAEPTAPVIRDGQVIELPSEEVVPGDVLRLQAGRRLPADARLLRAYGLMADESSLTGESAPVEKEAETVLPADTPLADRRNLVFAGTSVTRGRGLAVVTATGMGSELGCIAGLARQVEEPKTPLQKGMDELSRWLIWLALGFSLIVPILGLLAGQPLRLMLLTGLSLAFATIPEEMPIIITMVLALGGYRLSRQKAIAKRLRAVESLGAVTAIATDKTGTLTENRMRLERVQPAEAEERLLATAFLCSDVVASGGALRGDPMEAALLRRVEEIGLHPGSLRDSLALVSELSFDNSRKMMSAVYRRDGGLYLAAKGAPEAILSRSTWIQRGQDPAPLSEAERQAVLGQAAEMAAAGLRAIAVAERDIAGDSLSQDELERELTFIGLAGFADPPRPEVKGAIAEARAAGIRPLMVTGDHPLTAKAIAEQVGLLADGRVVIGQELDALSDEQLRQLVGEASVFARTTPEHKLRIVRALQASGELVAVTGDGTNDAPALAAADIGVAMGETGTDVAREAGDIVLADDNFATIVRAVAEGRTLFANLSKGVRYYLTCKVALISATLLPVLLRVPVPFAPVQIILMELFMDLAAAATFVAEPPEAGIMRRPPRDPRAPFMDRAMVTSIFASAAGLFLAVSLAYLRTWHASGDLPRAQTVAFFTWLLGHVLLAANMRSERQPLFRLGLFRNRLMLAWGAATVAFVAAVSLLPGLQAAFRATSLSAGEWLMVVGLAIAGTFWLEVARLVRWWAEARTETRA